MPAPIYQYRLILVNEDKTMLNVASDLDFNVEGELKHQLNDVKNSPYGLSLKSNFTVSDLFNLLI